MMEVKSWKKFNRDLRWSTKIYALSVVLVILFSVIFNAWQTDWSLTLIAAVGALFLIETFFYGHAHNPGVWQTILWILILILAAILLMGHLI